MSAFLWRGVRLSLSSGAMMVLALAAGACGGGDGGDSGKVQVVTTLPLFADFVREVGGDRVEVTSLVPTGADPHTFEPSPSDVKKIAEADIAFANGLDLEPSAIRLIEANLPDGAPFVRLGEEAEVSGGLADSEHKIARAGDNPHLWLNVVYAFAYADMIRASLANIVTVNSQGPESYNGGFSEYGQKLLDLEVYVQARIGPPLSGGRKLVTTHDAFEYLGEAYGLEIVAVVAQSPGQEPSPEDVANLTRAIEEQDVPAVFREPQIDAEGRILEQAANAAGVQVCTLYSDSLDDKVTSYIEMMRFNADEIARCLGGDSGG